MNIIAKIADIFIQTEMISVCDELHTFHSKYRILGDSVHPLDEKQFSEITTVIIQNALEVSLKFIFEDQEEIGYLISKNTCPEVKEIKDKIENALKFRQDEDVCYIEILVYKDSAIAEKNKIHVFDFDSFSESFHNESDEHLLDLINSFDLNKEIIFSVWEDFTPFNTKTIKFQKYDGSNVNKTIIDRHSIISKRNKSCHFTNDAQYKLLPEDFYLYDECKYEKIKDRFNSFLMSFLIIYLSDYSELINENERNLTIDYKLKGYRLITEKTKINHLHTNVELFEIYNWIYDGGNFVDKIGLARNILSIHMVTNSITSIAIGTLKSIESGYDIYLKENVKQYIEVKNKISEFLISQSDKASEITKNMFSTLKTSFWSIITFFTSVFLIKIVTSNSYKGVVTLEIFIVTIVFVLFSLIYWFVTTKEVNEERDRLLNKYDKIRDRYKDLLNEEDLNNIINTTQLKSDEAKYINNRRKRFSFIWNGFNIMIIIVISLLFYFGDNKAIENNPLPKEDISQSNKKSDYLEKKQLSEKENQIKKAQPLKKILPTSKDKPVK